MLIGLIAGLATGAMWGLTFVAPRAVEPFSIIDLNAARYGVFGVASFFIFCWPRAKRTELSRKRVLIGLWLGASGYVGYGTSVGFAVHYAGAAIPPLIIGTLPVLLPLIANWRERAVPWRALALPLGLIALGIGVVDAAALATASLESRASIVTGSLFALTALAIWLGYGIVNAAVMRGEDAPDDVDWTVVQGFGAGLASLALLPLTSGSAALSYSMPDGLRFWVWAVLLGIGASWFATWLWVFASRRLSLALSSQLIVAETVFGLGFGFLFEGRLPSMWEGIGALLQMTGVGVAIAVFSKVKVRTRQA